VHGTALAHVVYRFGKPKGGRSYLHFLGRVALVFYGLISTLHLQPEGSYVARTMNGHALPAELRIPVYAGDIRLFRLEQGVLRLSPGRRFTLYFRYYHQLVRRGTRPTSTPVLSDSETGTYVLNKGRLLLTPTKKNGSKPRPSIQATIVGEDITASYLLQTGGSQERITLALRRDASYW
jgi:hypothetical protein